MLRQRNITLHLRELYNDVADILHECCGRVRNYIDTWARRLIAHVNISPFWQLTLMGAISVYICHCGLRSIHNEYTTKLNAVSCHVNRTITDIMNAYCKDVIADIFDELTRLQKQINEIKAKCKCVSF